MNLQNRRGLRDAAARSLAAAPGSPRAVVLVFAGIACGLTLLSAVVSYLLSHQIAGTGGLANMGMRSILSTAQYVLPLVQTVVLMCLELGYHKATLNMARGQVSEPRTLLEGFYHFGPILRTTLLQGFLYMGIGIAAMYLSSYIFLMLPLSEAFYEVMEPILASMSSLDTAMPAIDEATLAVAMSAMAPMVWIFAIVFCILVLPMVYSFRMVFYCLADSPRPGALAALRESRMMMRRNRIALFKLDLCFWWYYLLQALVSVICYGDVLLPMVGVELPWSDAVSYFLFYMISLALQLAVYYFFMNRVQVTYAAVYDILRPKPRENQSEIIL